MVDAAGIPFSEVAQKYSECPTAKRGGEIGWLDRGVYFPQFEQAAYGAAVGELVRATTGRGHHLIKVLEERWDVGGQQGRKAAWGEGSMGMRMGVCMDADMGTPCVRGVHEGTWIGEAGGRGLVTPDVIHAAMWGG